MEEAIGLARQGLGLTSPNPPVGAVLVRDGVIIGRGWHHKAGGPHAEVGAIANAREDAGDEAVRASDLYVTLEPCSTTGRTPPCVEAILEAGIRRVYVGSVDPNPLHAGAGLEVLRGAGVEVATGLREEETDELIRFFRSRVVRGRPWVIAKSAMTLDGRTTLSPGEGPWVSCPESRRDVQKWRRQCDAILVGGETFRHDNPRLTLRGEFADDREQPLRVVLSREGELPPGHHLFTDEHRDRTRVFQRVSIREALGRLAAEGVNAVLLESGGRLLEHALSERLVDEVLLYLAPRIGGGESRVIPGDLPGANLESMEVKKVGTDLRIRGRVSYLPAE